MVILPETIIQVLDCFASLFSRRVWPWATVLIVGALLAPGKRTVTACLRVMGLSDEVHFQNYHRLLNRAVWSSRQVARILLRLLLDVFVAPDAAVVLGIDETIERRRGTQIAARGIYRDAVRSSKEFFVKTSGLRWISLMLLAPIPWIGRVWALPFLTVLAPSERYHAERQERHKKITDWARQMILQVRRWLPGRRLVVVADGSYAVLELLDACRRLTNPFVMITRLRLDAALYDPAPPRQPGAKGRPRKKGPRQPTLAARLADPTTVWQRCAVSWYGGGLREVELASGTAVWYHAGLPVVPIRWVLIRDPRGKFEPQALLCTDLEVRPEQIVAWFVLRWQVEVTFEESRRHLGVETQRQWSDLAILRTTPALLGLFSLVTLLVHRLLQGQDLPTRQAAWYHKANPSFSDALAFLRLQLWPARVIWRSSAQTEIVEIPRGLLDCLTDMLAYAT
jgi:DDE superfamily endonuclease